MFKIVVIALTIAASSAAAVIPSATPISGGTAIAGPATRPVQRVNFESTQCRTAARQIAVYSRAHGRLDMSVAHNRYKAEIYRLARQAERDWQAQNRRPRAQTAVAASHDRTL